MKTGVNFYERDVLSLWFLLILVFSSHEMYGQETITGNPQADYYSMLNSMQPQDLNTNINSYIELRNLAKGLEIGGLGLALISTKMLISELDKSPSNTGMIKFMYAVSGIAVTSGILINWATIKRIRDWDLAYFDGIIATREIKL